MNTRYEILPRTVRFAASFAAVLCTTAVMAGIAGLAEVEPTGLDQTVAPVMAATGQGNSQTH